MPSPIEQQQSMASKQMEALNDDEIEVAYHMVMAVVDDSLDKEVQAYLEHHPEEVNVH